MSMNYRAPHARGANAIDGTMTGKYVSADGNRTIASRYYKVSIGDGRYDAVEAWVLRERIDGRMKIVDTGMSEKVAFEFIGEGAKKVK